MRGDWSSGGARRRGFLKVADVFTAAKAKVPLEPQRNHLAHPVERAQRLDHARRHLAVDRDQRDRFAAFGKDVARQKALSPTLHAAAPNVANWLILPIDRRDDSKAQSQGLATALRPAGVSAKVVAVPGESHSSLNKGLGEDGDFATGEVDKFLAALR